MLPDFLLPSEDESEDIKMLWIAWQQLVNTLADNEAIDLLVLSKNLSSIEWVHDKKKEDEKALAQRMQQLVEHIADLASCRPSSDDRFHNHVLACIEEINTQEGRLAQQADLIEIYDDITDEEVVRVLTRLYKADKIVADVIPAAIKFENISVRSVTTDDLM